MDVTIGKSLELISMGQAIRYQVFTLEQNIPTELDLDGLDNDSFHALVWDGGKPVATARLTVNQDGSSTMARVAVSEEYRGDGVASKIVRALIKHASSIGVKCIDIHAHAYLRKYYENFGFEYIREVEIVGEHQLIEMKYQMEPAV